MKNGDVGANATILESFQATSNTNESVQLFSLFRPSVAEDDKTKLEEELRSLREQLAAAQEKSDRTSELTSQLQDSRAQQTALAEELHKTKKDLEDLFILLADQDSKLKEYKTKLRNHGEIVSDDEGDAEDLDIEELDDEDFTD